MRHRTVLLPLPGLAAALVILAPSSASAQTNADEIRQAATAIPSTPSLSLVTAVPVYPQVPSAAVSYSNGAPGARGAGRSIIIDPARAAAHADAPQEVSDARQSVWRVTLASGESYSDVSLVDVRGDQLVIGRNGDTAMIPVERIAELRWIRSWSTWRTIGYGAMAGGVAGYVTGALVKSDEPASTFLAAGLAGGALVGWLVGEALSPADDVYDMTGMSRLERTETIGRLLTR